MGLSYDDILETWREADSTPVFEHAWLWDHMVPLRGDVRGAALEAWTLLSALAAQTTRLRLGIIVTSNRLRLPTLLAKMAATVDIISAGRLIFGIGAGGSFNRSFDEAALDLVRREFEAYGVEIVPTADAIAALGEALTIARRMWEEPEPFDFDGRFYTLRGAICEPKPVQRPGPPILVGAGGEQLSLRVVAEHADIWNCPTADPAEFTRKSDVLDRHCAAIGRDPADIVRSVQVIIRGNDVAEARATVLALVEAGATHLVLGGAVVRQPTGRSGVRWLAEEVVDPVLDHMS
jgi:alkanesulfonate monooxygenase SsuD/methylene tetrahydromethanopterin reductase-like flavin-dependent oxidoreductase (luciferase family)